MKSFTRLHVSGFRRLQSVDLEMRPLAVLIGANGSGKTSFLDVLSLLSAAASENLSAKIRDLEGITSILTLDGTRDLRINTSMESSATSSLEYTLKLSLHGNSYQVTYENLARWDENPPISYFTSDENEVHVCELGKESGMVAPPLRSSVESTLCQMRNLPGEIEDFRKLLSSFTYYHSLNVEPRSPIRLPQPLRPATLPGGNGEDLVSCLFYMRETDRDRFETIEATLRAAFPGFQRLEFPPVAAGMLALAWRDERFKTPLYLYQLSEGTLRFLWLATLLQSPGLTSFTLLDEPEVSLHPELLCLFADLLREASERTQVVVATHSDRLISFLKPEEVVVMDVEEDGMVTATWANQMDLEEWLNEYTLEEMWRMGRIGGRS